jgi:hypothetical protein
MVAKAGWYPDAAQPGQERYWDGARWTEERRELPRAVAAADAAAGAAGAILLYLFLIGAALAAVGAVLLYTEFPRVGTSLSMTGNTKAAVAGLGLMWIGTLVLLVPLVGWGVKYGTRAARV